MGRYSGNLFVGCFVGPEIPDTFSFYPHEWRVRIIIIRSNPGTIFSV